MASADKPTIGHDAAGNPLVLKQTNHKPIGSVVVVDGKEEKVEYPYCSEGGIDPSDQCRDSFGNNFPSLKSIDLKIDMRRQPYPISGEAVCANGAKAHVGKGIVAQYPQPNGLPPAPAEVAETLGNAFATQFDNYCASTPAPTPNTPGKSGRKR